MNYVILPVEQRDFIFIAHLEQDLRGADAWSVSQIMAADENFASILGAFDTEEILVGYIVVQSAADEAEIQLIGVDDLHQRQGLGGRLMDAAMDILESKQVKEVFLEVRKSNTAAISLYKKCGFEQVGVRKAYYGTHKSTQANQVALKEDAVVMKVLLKNYQSQKI